MKSEPITVPLTFTTERDARLFCRLHFSYIDGLDQAAGLVRAELARRRRAKRDAKKAALVVDRQGDSLMLKRDWK